MIDHQTKPSCERLWLARLSPHTLPSRKMCETKKRIEESNNKQLCHLFCESQGITAEFLRAPTTIVESLSNQRERQPYLYKRSIAYIAVISSALKAKVVPRWTANHLIKPPSWFLKIPPPVAILGEPNAAPSTFTLIQPVGGGGCQMMDLGEIFFRGWPLIKKLWRIEKSSMEGCMVPLEKVPVRDTEDKIKFCKWSIGKNPLWNRMWFLLYIPDCPDHIHYPS